MAAITPAITTATANFDKTTVARILQRLATNLRRDLRYTIPGAYLSGSIIPGTNLIRHVSLSDMSILSPAQSDGTPPWLYEGTPPTSEALTIGYDEFGVNQAGRTVTISDRALSYSPFDLFREVEERVYWNAVSTIDAIIAGVAQGISGTTTNGHAIGALTASDYLTADLVRLMVAKLRVNGVPTFQDGYYIAIVHPYAVYDLQTDTKWVNVANYAEPGVMLTGEVGRLYGVRFVTSTVGTWINNTSGSGAIAAYSSLFFGQDFMAVGDFGSIEIWITRPGRGEQGMGDHSDPLGQSAIVGWKAYVGAKVLTTLGTRAFRLVHAGSTAGAASI